jgi:hypothetical protein
MNEENRFCEPFSMTPQEFDGYKRSKSTRIAWYILAMIFVSIFNERMFGYVYLTFLLIFSYWYDSMKEKQWKKDGSMRDEDMR